MVAKSLARDIESTEAQQTVHGLAKLGIQESPPVTPSCHV